MLEQETAKIKAETEKIKNEEISQSLTKEMLMKMTIEKWDGSLPKVISSDAAPILDITN